MARLKNIAYVTETTDVGRLDLLVARLTELSRARVRGLIDHGGVRVNDLAASDGGIAVNAGDRLAITFDPERRYKEKPATRATHGFTIVFEDQHLVVVNKEAGILTVPTPKGETNTLIDLLSRHLSQGKPQGRKRLVSVVHRLDRDTSGLLVFGRTQGITDDIIAQFAGRKPEREYAAIVAGNVAEEKGTIRSHLATDKALNQRSVSDSGRGELAITHYEVRARYKTATLLAVHLETGRRNQIRVHCAELGHPILGDTRYSADAAQHPLWPHKRLALHARLLGFVHPATGRTLRFECPLPGAFAAFGRG